MAIFITTTAGALHRAVYPDPIAAGSPADRGLLTGRQVSFTNPCKASS